MKRHGRPIEPLFSLLPCLAITAIFLAAPVGAVNGEGAADQEAAEHSVILTQPSATPANIRALAANDDLQELHIICPAVGTSAPELIAAAAELTSLKRLRLVGLPAADMELTQNQAAPLRMLDQLEVLELNFVDLSACDLAVLSDLPLSRLSLRSSGVDDHDLQMLLGGIEELAVLDLFDTNITDAAIPAIQEHPALSIIGIGDTNITVKGLAQLVYHDSLAVGWKSRVPFRYFSLTAPTTATDD